jgi:hypothetical protein
MTHAEEMVGERNANYCASTV